MAFSFCLSVGRFPFRLLNLQSLVEQIRQGQRVKAGSLATAADSGTPNALFGANGSGRPFLGTLLAVAKEPMKIVMAPAVREPQGLIKKNKRLLKT